MFCHKCGTQMPEDSRFCRLCGTVLLPVPNPAVMSTVGRTGSVPRSAPPPEEIREAAAKLWSHLTPADLPPPPIQNTSNSGEWRKRRKRRPWYTKALATLSGSLGDILKLAGLAIAGGVIFMLLRLSR